MGLLSDISAEQDRITATGQKAIVVWMNTETRQAFNQECLQKLGHLCKTIYGMDVRLDIALPYGVVRLGTRFADARLFPG